MGVQRTACAVFLLAVLIFAVLLTRFFQQDRGDRELSSYPVIVLVEGDVKNRGVYVLDGPEAALADAIKAAGGIRSNCSAELSEQVLNRQVQSGRSVRIVCEPSGRVEISMQAMTAAARLTIGLKLDLNEASEDDLSLISRMKSDMASAIVRRRLEKPWRSMRELREISGVGPKTIEKWSAYLEVSDKAVQ
ncbi:MAG: ComEA family DNA-binding protein [Syntrophobacteraceae bacterium]